MKAISLWQPYATLMAAGYKRIETRSWAPRGLRMGDLVAIHAAKRWSRAERELCREMPFERSLTLAKARGLWDFENPPLGCVVAIARFWRAAPTQGGGFDKISWEEYEFGNFAPGRYGWIFNEVRPIAPVPLRGERFLFNWIPPHQSAVGDGLTYLEPWNRAVDAAGRDAFGKAGMA